MSTAVVATDSHAAEIGKASFAPRRHTTEEARRPSHPDGKSRTNIVIRESCKTRLHLMNTRPLIEKSKSASSMPQDWGIITILLIKDFITEIDTLPIPKRNNGSIQEQLDFLIANWTLLEQTNDQLRCLLVVSEVSTSKMRMHMVARMMPTAGRSTSDVSNQTAKSKVLKYYNNSTQPPRPSSVPQILDFRTQRYDTSGMPATIPQELWDMRLEENRFKSFHLSTRFTSEKLVSIKELAADGFFYMQEADKVKCAFCKGVLKDWEAGEQVREAHRRHFSTCPFVLFVEVSNVPRENRDSDPVSVPEQCSDESTDACVMVLGDWESKIIPDLPPMEAEAVRAAALSTDGSRLHRESSGHFEAELLCLATQSPMPVSGDVARSACSEKALTNLAALQNRFATESPAATAAHPELASYSARFESLATSPFQQAAYLLAKAGFCYLTKERVTCCYSCGLKMRSWSCDDNAWIEHARWSPRCHQVLVNRGYEFVLAVHKTLPPVNLPTPTTVRSASIKDSSTRADKALAMTPGVEFRVEARDIKARADLPAVRLLSQLGFSSLQVRLFTELHLRQFGDDFSSSELFLDFMFSESRRMREASQDPEAYYQAKYDEIKRNADCQPIARDVIDWRTCKVCMDKEVNIGLIDCGHVACCSICVKSLKTCPICRAFIRGTLVIKI